MRRFVFSGERNETNISQLKFDNRANNLCSAFLSENSKIKPNTIETMNPIIFWFFVVCCSFVLLENKFRCWRRNYAFWRKVPFVGLRCSWLSSVTNVKSKSLQYADFYQKYKHDTPIVGIYTMFGFFGMAALITDKDRIQRVFKDFPFFQNREMFKNVKDDPLTANLGTLKYQEWKQVRPKLTKAFSPLKLREMMPTIAVNGNQLVEWLNDEIKRHNQIEICDIFDRFMIDTIGAVSFNLECNTLTNPNSELRTMLQKAKRTTLGFPWNLLADSFPSIARLFGRTKHDKDVADYFVHFFRNEIEKRRTNQIVYGDFLDHLMGLGRTENETIALAFDLLSPGSTDASLALTYCVYELSLEENIHIQIKARHEIQSVLDEYNGLTTEALNKLVYCKNILKGSIQSNLFRFVFFVFSNCQFKLRQFVRKMPIK